MVGATARISDAVGWDWECDFLWRYCSSGQHPLRIVALDPNSLKELSVCCLHSPLTLPPQNPLQVTSIPYHSPGTAMVQDHPQPAHGQVQSLSSWLIWHAWLLSHPWNSSSPVLQDNSPPLLVFLPLTCLEPVSPGLWTSFLYSLHSLPM